MLGRVRLSWAINCELRHECFVEAFLGWLGSNEVSSHSRKSGGELTLDPGHSSLRLFPESHILIEANSAPRVHEVDAAARLWYIRDYGISTGRGDGSRSQAWRAGLIVPGAVGRCHGPR
jgi:hypothetical protein